MLHLVVEGLAPQAGSGSAIRLGREDAHRLVKVLRLRPGEPVTLLDPEGGVRVRGRLGEGGCLEVEAVAGTGPDPHPDLTVWIGLARGDAFEGALVRLVELGVRRLVPLVTERVQGRPSPKLGERCRRLAVSALEQSGRSHMPGLGEAEDLASALSACRAQGRAAVVLDPTGAPGLDPGQGPLGLLIGPEGGFTPGELEAAREAGARVVSLGGHVLRVETAAVAAASLVLAGRGWLRL